MQLVSTLRVISTVFRMQLKQMAVDEFFIFSIVFQPVFIALLAIYMLRDSPGFQAVYVIVGSGMTGLWSGTLMTSTNGILVERWVGTLESIIASPTHIKTVVIGKSLANVTLSLASMLFSYPLAAFVFGYPLTISDPPIFVVSLLLMLLALLSLGMILTPLMAIRPGSEVWVNALEFPMYIVGGFIFPVALLPAWMTPISYVLAPYWAARALHASSSGGLSALDVLTSWGFLIILCVVYWFLSGWLFKIVLRRAREEATLGLQ
jgi:ABC-2 type transport system permease protein